MVFSFSLYDSERFYIYFYIVTMTFFVYLEKLQRTVITFLFKVCFIHGQQVSTSILQFVTLHKENQIFPSVMHVLSLSVWCSNAG